MDTAVKLLLDTNILVYGEDKKNPQKQILAIEFIDDCIKRNNGVLSIQNLVEFSNVLNTKINLPSHDINERIKDFSTDFDLIHYNKDSILKANEYCEKFRTDFFDALIIATMEENGISIIATENVDHFSFIPWLTVINPFKKK
ncbi:MAG: PIN domain-containing protein [Sphingobacterium sp.]